MLVDRAAHDALSLPRPTCSPCGETVRGRYPHSHLMNAVPGLRFPVQGGSLRVRQGTDLRPAMRPNVAPLHRMHDAGADTHQRGSAPLSSRDELAGRMRSVRFLRRNAHALEGTGQPDSVT